jgi:hypothetical protein
LAKAESRAERLAGVVAWACVQLRVFARHEGTDDLSRRCGLAAEEIEKQTALADADKPDRAAECRHGIEGAAADPSICSVCVWDGLSPEEQDLRCKADAEEDELECD